MTPKRPILRYHGGKWRLARWILSHFPTHRVYVEPYAGAGSVLLQKSRAYCEVYNDLDGEVVNLFRVARDSGKDLVRALELTPFARAEYRESFREEVCDPVERARRTVVRSFMGFGSNALCRRSGFRANSNRSGTTPAHDWQNFPEALVDIIERLRGVVIENRPAFEVMAAHDSPETLHYCDPPYLWETRSKAMHGHRGYRFEMSESDHAEMAGFLKTLKGSVVVSGYPSPFYDELFDGWKTVSIAALADGAKQRTEMLWLSPGSHGAAQTRLAL